MTEKWNFCPVTSKRLFIFFSLKKNNFIYLFLDVLGLRCCSGFFSSSCSKRRLLSAACELLIAVASLVELEAPGSMGFSSCSSQALEHRLGVVVHRLHCSEVCRIFPDQDWNCVSCIGRWILHHWATGEAPPFLKILSMKVWNYRSNLKKNQFY